MYVTQLPVITSANFLSSAEFRLYFVSFTNEKKNEHMCATVVCFVFVYNHLF